MQTAANVKNMKTDECKKLCAIQSRSFTNKASI